MTPSDTLAQEHQKQLHGRQITTWSGRKVVDDLTVCRDLKLKLVLLYAVRLNGRHAA